jgi:hypothetical protein
MHTIVKYVGALLFCMQSALAQPLWTAVTDPLDGNIGGPAGSTIGWGYEIANPDAALWLVLTGVSADPFLHGTPLALFDLPVLAPGLTLNQAFDGVNGLYGISWDASAPQGFVNSGAFLLTAEWWDGDPLAGGSFVELADNLSLDYSAIVTQQGPGELPEPALPLLMGMGLAAALLARRYRGGATRK